MVKKFTSTKVVETKIGSFPDLPEEVNTYLPPKMNKKLEEEKKQSNQTEININTTCTTVIKPNLINKQCETTTLVKTSSKNKKHSDAIELSDITLLPAKSVSSTPPSVHLSPMRTRLLERTVEKVPLEEKKEEKKKESRKPRKKVVVDVKSPPKVFKSPTWYKSPSKKVVKEEDLVFKQLLLKDPKLTERDITKILADHK
jgi:hypothetical protein